METHNWRPVTPETLPDHGFSIPILLKKEGNLGEERNRILVARIEFGTDGFARSPKPIHQDSNINHALNARYQWNFYEVTKRWND